MFMAAGPVYNLKHASDMLVLLKSERSSLARVGTDWSIQLVNIIKIKG